MRPTARFAASMIVLGACNFPRTVVLDDAGDVAQMDVVASDAIDTAEVGRVDVSDATDAVDRGTTDTLDVVPDVVDAPPDITTDAPTDLDPPRQIAPMSTSTVTSRQPTLHWLATAGASGTDVVLCRQRNCTSIAQEFTASGDHGAPPTPLAAGVWFWRARSMCGASPCARSSPTWEFTVGAATGTIADTSFGTHLDVDGDGNADLLVGASQTLGGPHGTMVGAADVYLGPDLTAFTHLASPMVSASFFGTCVASAGDVNGDGFGDVIVGTSDAGGAVYLYFGASSGWGSATAPTSAMMLVGAGDGFGTSCAGVGDIDGDGYGDIVVGAPTASTDSGLMYVFRGAPSGLMPVPSMMIMPPSLHGHFGTVVTAAGDVNGDGLADVAVSAPTLSGGGVVYVYGGSGTGLGAASSVLHAPLAAPGFGDSLAGAGDLNGDGLADLVVGAPTADPTGNGAVFIYLGNQTTYIASGTPQEHDDSQMSGGDRYGASVSITGDVDGDGNADIVIGASGSPFGTGGGNFGRVYVALSRSGGASFTFSMVTFPGAFANAFGTSVALADYDNDGFADMSASDPHVAAGNSRVSAYRGSASGIVTTAFTSVMPATSNDDFGNAIATVVPDWRRAYPSSCAVLECTREPRGHAI